MEKIYRRELSKYKYYNPFPILSGLQEIRYWLALHPEVPPSIRNLRTNSLKAEREAWAAAIFALLRGELLGRPVFFARQEASDYDFVCRYIPYYSEEFEYEPVQLKEVVPKISNSLASVQAVVDEIAKGRKYRNSCVAIKHTAPGTFDPTALDLSKLDVASLWVFGSATPDERSWILWGDLLKSPNGRQFDMPF